MRVLAIETTSVRGSVALIEGDQLVASAEHREPSAHAERILPLIQRIIEEAGWTQRSIERIGVGIGPGSFVGLRVGIALAEGMSIGLGCPVVGVPSLHAMCRAVPSEHPGARIALVDARRGEVFVTALDALGAELVAVHAVARARVAESLAAISEPALVVGDVTPDMSLPWPSLRGAELDLPHAHWVGRLATTRDPASHPPVPCYVRGAGATLPNLPPSPLGE